MELRHLRYFVAIAEELNFTRAAARLYIGQPPLSKQIRDLEAELSVKLFDRTRRKISLTDPGRALLREARIILELVEHSRSSVQQIMRGEQGTLRVGFNSSASFNQFVPSVIGLYRESYPDVRLVLRESSSTMLIGELREGTLDVAFLRANPDEAEGLRIQHLFDEKMLIALPRAHKLSTKKILPLKALAFEPFVLYPRGNGSAIFDAIITACRDAGFSPRLAQEAPQISSTVNLVAAGIGVAIVPESMGHLQAEGVIYRPITGPSPVATMSLACRGGTVSAVVEKFMRLVEKVTAEKQSPKPIWSRQSNGEIR
jgi:DNA-binding transcriptional LysR family regulator